MPIDYQSAKFLGKLLHDVIPNDHFTKDTFSFVEELKTISVTNKYMVSYNITSLFTNIPLEEIIWRHIYDQVHGVVMGLPLAPLLANIFMGYHKKGGLGITIMESCFITKGMSMIYLQFLKLKIMLLHFTIISIGNTGI